MRGTIFISWLMLASAAFADDFKPQAVVTIKDDVVIKESAAKLQLGVLATAKEIKDGFYVTDLGSIKLTDAVPVSEAVKVLTEQIEENPTTKAYVGRARVNENLRRPQAAKRDFSAAIKLDPNNSDLYSLRAQLEMQYDEMDQAIADCDQALKLNPSSFPATHLKESIEKKRATLDDQIQTATKFVQTSKNLSNYHNRGLLYARKRDYQKALDDFNAALKLKPNHTESLYWRGIANEKLGNYAQALADYRKLVSLSPKDAYGYAALSTLFAKCPDAKIRNSKEAVAMALKAEKIWETEPAAIHSLMATAYAENGEWDKAVEYQSKAIQENQFSDIEQLEEDLEKYKNKQPQSPLPEGKNKDSKTDSKKTDAKSSGK